jgi:hypothetical protein
MHEGKTGVTETWIKGKTMWGGVGSRMSKSIKSRKGSGAEKATEQRQCGMERQKLPDSLSPPEPKSAAADGPRTRFPAPGAARRGAARRQLPPGRCGG